MDQFQLNNVFNDRAAPRERRLPLGSTWQFQTHSPSVNRCKTPCFRRLPLRNALPPLEMFRPHRGHWPKSAARHPIICRQPTHRRPSCPSPRKLDANLPHVAVIQCGQASVQTSRCGSSIISAARHLTPFPLLPASRHASRSSRYLCIIMLRPSMPWSRDCPRHPQSDAWPLTSSPDMVRSA